MKKSIVTATVVRLNYARYRQSVALEMRHFDEKLRVSMLVELSVTEPRVGGRRYR